MSLFGNLKSDGLEESQDRLGGGFQPLDTDIYDVTIKAFYAGKSAGGAHNVSIIGTLPDGKEYRETVYITNKNGENFFLNKQDKSKKVPLPGFTIIDDICLIVTGKPLAEVDFEEKTLNLWDFEAKKELPKAVMCATEIHGQVVKLGIWKKLEDVNKKNDQTGEYEPTGESKETNSIDKVYHPEQLLTVAEARAGKDVAEFHDKWLEKNKGQVRDERENKGAAQSGVKSGPPKADQPAAGGTDSPRKSLFANKK
ncbi:single strand DNA binding protein [Pseudomonas phage Zuri]|uniref:DNA repair protein n=1 Tax=Pseudomonas phage Zuri TaxID=2604899 RepID=A0A5C1K6Y4_9CAUD|nr:single strand DNA binding protein [Pseudomonas phage Zuri]QEM41164.1 DNA repair protein [Pseudomonas phage Zuri]